VRLVAYRIAVGPGLGLARESLRQNPGFKVADSLAIAERRWQAFEVEFFGSLPVKTTSCRLDE